MQINWFTVIAQVINFLILVFLLKKFLYKPVLDAIDERERKIVVKLEDAEAKEVAAKKEQDEFEQKNRDFDIQRKELLDTAIAETTKRKEVLMEEARKAIDTLQSKQQKAMQDTQEKFEKELAHKTQQEVFNISRKALEDLASISLEEQAAILFVTRIQELKGEKRQQFINVFNSSAVPVAIQSAFELDRDQQLKIEGAVQKVVGKDMSFHFKIAPEIISGIELTANGYKMEWSISSYLSALQDSVTIAEETEVESESKSS